ncbi:ABC transporter permease [Porcincola intestinalis]|uniref:ABC transporter permease n=1 Tax=Porcincola intestinalis TaxID=2606632 RepID=A0A6L5X9M1_9FIRM|nr:ABC transporter permease [Porcincola intestinalis]MCI6766808.1 ABC transporter permease [Lachnospiraceae bacterium]MDD7059233.1 ABC transporter permease [Porcincola intestinalis]MDY5284167.1 ABC transporter permease [Porcincola intestinalis]MSS15736.1 ABC transporter permease [Porcincola intestinalis]
MNNKKAINKSESAGKFELVRQLTLAGLLVLEVIIFSIMSKTFLTTSNIINVLRQVSITGISSVGMFMIILLGDIDLSVGSMYAFIGVLCAMIFKSTGTTVLTVLAALVLGMVIGLFNGVITARFRIPAFITTLATMSMCRGFAYILTGGSPIGVTSPKFTILGTGYIFNTIPLPVIFMIIVLLCGSFLVRKTRFGRYIYSCGGNAQAAQWSGINVDMVKIVVYLIAGLLNGFAAIILAGRLGGGLPATGEGSEMDVITAVVLGGTSMSGGKGKLWGVMLGVLIIGVLTNGLTMINVSTYWQKVIKGLIILVAVIMDNQSTKSA